MKIQNQTNIPTALFRRLLDFVVPLAPAAALARIEILPGVPGKLSGGLAYKFHPATPDPLAPSLIQLWVSPAGCRFWPHEEQHVPELSPFWVESWEEHLLLVVAHECWHVVDFWNGDLSPVDAVHELEIRAESFAIETVKAWRKRHQKTQRAA